MLELEDVVKIAMYSRLEVTVTDVREDGRDDGAEALHGRAHLPGHAFSCSLRLRHAEAREGRAVMPPLAVSACA